MPTKTSNSFCCTSSSAAASCRVMISSVTARIASRLSRVDDSSVEGNAESSQPCVSAHPRCRYCSSKSRNASLEMILASRQRNAILK